MIRYAIEGKRHVTTGKRQGDGMCPWIPKRDVVSLIL